MHKKIDPGKKDYYDAHKIVFLKKKDIYYPNTHNKKVKKNAHLFIKVISHINPTPLFNSYLLGEKKQFKITITHHIYN